jgi:hypothetical protein
MIVGRFIEPTMLIDEALVKVFVILWGLRWRKADCRTGSSVLICGVSHVKKIINMRKING